MNRNSILVHSAAVIWAQLVACGVALTGNPPVKGLGDPGPVQSLSIETGRTVNGEFLLDGPDASQQLIVTGHFTDGQVRDLTRSVRYQVAPTDAGERRGVSPPVTKVVDVSSSGLVLPRADGAATITVNSSGGLKCQHSRPRHQSDRRKNLLTSNATFNRSSPGLAATAAAATARRAAKTASHCRCSASRRRTIISDWSARAAGGAFFPPSPEQQLAPAEADRQGAAWRRRSLAGGCPHRTACSEALDRAGHAVWRPG